MVRLSEYYIVSATQPRVGPRVDKGRTLARDSRERPRALPEAHHPPTNTGSRAVCRTELTTYRTRRVPDQSLVGERVCGRAAAARCRRFDGLQARLGARRLRREYGLLQSGGREVVGDVRRA